MSSQQLLTMSSSIAYPRLGVSLIWYLFTVSVISIENDIFNIKLWLVDNVNISGTIDITIPYDNGTSYQCVLTGLTQWNFAIFWLDNQNQCFLYIIDPGFASEYEWGGKTYYYYECYNNAIESADATENMVLRYTGDSDFTLDQIVYRHWPDITWYTIAVSSFCVPENHYLWASETWTTNCNETSSLDIYSPSTTFYITYNITDSESNQNLEGVVSPSKLSKVIITARLITIPYDEDTHGVVLKFQWDRYVHQCTIALTTISNTYYCDRESTLLEHTNCSESAFVAEFEQTNSDEIRIDSISVIDEDNRTYLIDDSICFSQSSIVVDFSTVWSDNNVSVYHIDNEATCLTDTVLSDIDTKCYTSSPSLDPTSTPSSNEPTLNPSNQPTEWTKSPTNEPTPQPTDVPTTTTGAEAMIETVISPTLAPLTADAPSSTELASKSSEAQLNSTGLLIGILCSVLLVSAISSLIAFLAVHRRRPGTDRPNYLSLLKFGFNAADFYTDLIWSLSLISEASEYAVYAFVFTIGSYAVSMIVGILYVTKWKTSHHSKEHLSGYATKYSKYVLIWTALAGFYATVEIITSHLCHIGVLSLHITTAQKQHIQTLRILNVVLLENLPLLIIQSLYLSSGSGDKQSEDLTMITFMFSSLSIISGISDGITNVCSRYITKHGQNDTVNKRMFIEFSLKESVPGHIHSYHVHSYNLLRRALAASLETEENQVDIYKIQQISSGLLVVAKLKFLSDDQVGKLSAELQNKQSQMRINVRRECTNNLKINVPRYVELNEFKIQTDESHQANPKQRKRIAAKNVFHHQVKPTEENVMSDIIRIAEEIEMPEVVESPVAAKITPFSFQESVVDDIDDSGSAGEGQEKNTIRQ